MKNAYHQLRQRFEKIAHFEHLRGIASWDESTMMPSGGGPARAEALASIAEHIHALLTAPEVGEWLAAVTPEQLASSWDQANVALMQRRYQLNTAIPADLVNAHAKTCLTTEQAWREYRQHNDWDSFLPHQEHCFNLSYRIAEHQADILGLSPYDAALAQYNRGETVASIDPLFNDLKTALPPLIEQAMAQQQQHPTIAFTSTFPTAQQHQLALTAMRMLTFNFDHGRLDTTTHPFCGGTPEDTRVTTFYDEDNLLNGLMGVCHETGHAKYEQQLPPQWRNQPVGEAINMAVHESQSLLVEMQLCRSRALITQLHPTILSLFGERPELSQDNLYRLSKQVSRSYIRIFADEITYPLHVILRYDIEKALFAKQLRIQDLPDAWDHHMQTHLGLPTQGNFQDGVMQDVHWPSGTFGYFPAYTLGRLMAAQWHQQLEQDIGPSEAHIQRGDLKPIFDWLKTHIHQHGSHEAGRDLLARTTGQPLSITPFINHIKQRYLD